MELVVLVATGARNADAVALVSVKLLLVLAVVVVGDALGDAVETRLSDNVAGAKLVEE